MHGRLQIKTTSFFVIMLTVEMKTSQATRNTTRNTTRYTTRYWSIFATKASTKVETKTEYAYNFSNGTSSRLSHISDSCRLQRWTKVMNIRMLPRSNDVFNNRTTNNSNTSQLPEFSNYLLPESDNYSVSESNNYSVSESATESSAGTAADSDVDGLYVLWFVVFTGTVGCFANGVVLAALIVDKKLRNNASTLLIKYQIGLDLVACVLLIVSYSLKMKLWYSQDTMKKLGNAICGMFVGDGLVTICLNAAAFNLVMIALERYVKIVHPVKHRSHFKKCVYMCPTYSTVFRYL